MAYAFEHDETVPAGVRRIMDEQLVRAREQLTDAKSPREKRIHNARKRFKETRALLRLVREPLGEHFALENAWFRDAGRDLASVRDADAVLEALEKLDLPRPLHNRVRKKLSTGRAEVNLDELIANTQAQLVIAQGRLGLWPDVDDSFDTLAPGLQRTYRDGRRALKRADSPEELHEWRKHVKTHWYHAQLLRHVWPEMMKSYAAVLEELSHALGDHHDLHVLHDAVPDAPQELLDAIDTGQHELERRAHEIGNRVYAERPPLFTARMEKLWAAWR
ncbi:MAG TPA: CHAD domain-containing protein [Thermoanaerobaculia bacterium]|nr:CHAD domain-containing protein [Thermoanaerobaculia bacterium]